MFFRRIFPWCIFLGVFSGLLFFVWTRNFFSLEPMVMGVSFSQPHAEYLGLDWKQAYAHILDDLKVSSVRLSAYWPKIEPSAGRYDFTDLDWQVEQAEDRNLNVVLALGRRLPRWPECHEPEWVKKMPEKERQQRVLKLLRVVIEHYKDFPSITAWQVENEPFLSIFGNCPKFDKEFFIQEVALVHSLDRRPVIITDSGELSFWSRSSRYADIVGTTLYRVVWNRYLGYFHHFFPPAFYRGRAWMAERFFGVQRVIVSELQAEPWFPNGDMLTVPVKIQLSVMNPEMIKENIEFAQRSGFNEIYLWGAEWWYWMKIRGEEDFWQEMKEILADKEK